MNKSEDGITHVNLDITGLVAAGRKASMLHEHVRIKSVLGFEYSCFKAVDKYLKVLSNDVGLFRELLVTEKTKANEMYRRYDISKRSKVTHHKCIMLFLMWERAMVDPEYREAILTLAHMDLKIRCYNANRNNVAIYKQWLIPLVKELMRVVPTNDLPNITKFSNGVYGMWHNIACYDGDIIHDVLELHGVNDVRSS